LHSISLLLDEQEPLTLGINFLRQADSGYSALSVSSLEEELTLGICSFGEDELTFGSYSASVCFLKKKRRFLALGWHIS
jgi:hypothetical protein